jgi:hypothetical protein
MSSSLLADRETDNLLDRDDLLDRERDLILGRDIDVGDCIACRELLLLVEADLAEYERELALRKPSLAVQLTAGFVMAGAALVLLLWTA